MRDVDYLIKMITILSDGQFHSGEEMGQTFGVSRAAIHKHIKTVRALGLDIDSIPRRGYCLRQAITLLDKTKILSRLPNMDPQKLYLFPIIDSTNQYLLNRINELTSGTVCLAEYQYQGRGRRGRNWFSPFGSNLYLSFYWRFPAGPDAMMGISQALGITVAKILRHLSGKDIKVKWPNDLYLDDKKLAGILVELIGRSGDDLHVVMGIGINLVMQVSEGIIDQKWSNLGHIDRNELSAELIHALFHTLNEFEQNGLSSFIEDWNALDNFYHRPVKLIMGDNTIYGVARGITDRGALQLEQDGVVTPYLGGEISLRPQTLEDLARQRDQAER